MNAHWKQIFRKNYLQLLFVFMTFFLMVTVSYIAISRIVEKHLQDKSREALLTAEAKIMESFSEADISLSNAAFTIENMLARGESKNVIGDYLDNTTRWMHNREIGSSYFLGVYGYIQGDLFRNYSMDPNSDYFPQNRPWYQAALRSGGKTVYTAPYVTLPYKNGERKGQTIISAVREIFDPSGTPQGIISLDMDLSWLDKHVHELGITDGSYGMITNQYLSITAHPNAEIIGRQLHEISPGYKKISDRLLRGEDITSVHVEDKKGNDLIVSFRKIFNGWYVAVITPSRNYYHDVYLTAKTLSVLGGVCMLFLSLMLLRLSAAKIRSDEENRNKSSFLSQMSHEIRTPMNAIIGMTGIVKKQVAETFGTSSPIVDNLNKITLSSEHLLGLLNNILDISKIGAGKIELSFEKTNLVELLKTVTTIIRPRAEERGVKFDFTANLFPDSTGMFLCDPLRLRQVLINLLGNAIKFTPENGTVSFTVEQKKHKKKGNRSLLKFSVRDTGIGIAKTEIHHLFTPFEQANSGITKSFGGTGLGLAISRSIVQMFGGDILVKSEPQRGSLFTFVIWLTNVYEQPEVEIALENLENSLVGKRALLVDDVDVNRIVAASVFDDTGLEIDEADDGTVAVEKFTESADGYYDIIYMDVQMPTMNGYDAAKAIRESGHPNAADIPIIALTANAFKDDVDRAIESGMNAHLAKPLNAENVLRLTFKLLKIQNSAESV